MEDIYFYGASPFNSWASRTTDFKPGKATRFHVLASTLTAWTTAYPDANVTFVGDLNTQDNPIPVYSAGDWAHLNELAQQGITIYAKLMRDIEVSTMLGTPEHPFTGVFDGNNNILIVNLSFDVTDSGWADCVAPFKTIQNATIKDLTVTGTITTSVFRRNAGGLVGYCLGKDTRVDNYITNCHITTNIGNKFGTLSGIIGFSNSSNVYNTVTGCLFDGKLSAENPLLDVRRDYTDNSRCHFMPMHP